MRGEMSGYNPEETQPRPERQETGAEQREKTERAAERLRSFEQSVDAAQPQMYAQAEQRVMDAVVQSGLTLEECSASEEVRQAAAELAAIQAEAATTGSETRFKIDGLKARLRRLVVGGSIALAALTGAAPLARAEAAEERPAAAVEQVEVRPSFDKVKQEALERLAGDKDLLAELGPENVKVIKRALERYDARQINAIAARLAGIDPSRTMGETPVELHILSRAGAEKMEKEDRGLMLDGSGAETMDRIFVMPGKRLDRHGRLTEETVLATLVHEQLHVANSPGVSDRNEMYSTGAAITVHEGMTEVMNMRILRELGVERRTQAYGGGTLASAYLMERVLGTREFARLYFEGGTNELHESLSRKLGREGATNILSVRLGIIDRLVGEAEGMETLLEIAQRAKLAGLDVERFAAEAGEQGLDERMVVAENGNMIVLSKESFQGELSQDLILDTGVRFTPHSFPVKISIDTRAERKGRPLERALRRINPITAQTAERIEKEYARSYDMTHNPDDDPMFLGRVGPYREMFHLVIEPPAEIQALKERYAKAASREEKTAIEKEAVQVLMQAAQEAARQVQAKRLAVK